LGADAILFSAQVFNAVAHTGIFMHISSLFFSKLPYALLAANLAERVSTAHLAEMASLENW
jgi:hypothetical protein